MNTNQLSDGMITKGYKHTCSILGDEYKGTNKKGIEYQKREWKRYFDWIEHTAYRWEITCVYAKGKDKIDGRVETSGNNNKFFSLVKPILINILQSDGSISMTKTRLLQEIGFVNENYENINYKSRVVSISKDIPMGYIKELKTIIQNKSKAVDRVIKHLVDNDIVSHTVDTVYKKFDGEIVVMTEGQVRVYAECSKDIVNRMGFNHKFDCYSANRMDEYNEKLRIVLRDKLNIYVDYVFEVVTLVYNGQDDADIDLGDRESNIDISEVMETLNNKVIQSVMDSVKKNNMKTRDKYNNDAVFGEKNVPEGKDTIYYAPECVSIFSKLCDEFIRI